VDHEETAGSSLGGVLCAVIYHLIKLEHGIIAIYLFYVLRELIYEKVFS